MGDRRRINGPAHGAQPALFLRNPEIPSTPSRSRRANELRKIFLQTGLVPSANGSAYLELEGTSIERSFQPTRSIIKLSCTVHGPKPLPRTSSFSPNLQLTASVKFAPFATRQRRGYIRDNIERDLGTHLENALKGAIIPDRWPKSAIEIAVTVIEGEEDYSWHEDTSEEDTVSGVGLMNVLAASINVSAAALADAKIDSLDLVVGGVSARTADRSVEILDPCPSEHEKLSSACVIGYLPSRDEVVEIWLKTSASDGSVVKTQTLIDSATKAARGAQRVLTEVLREGLQLQRSKGPENSTKDTKSKT